MHPLYQQVSFKKRSVKSQFLNSKVISYQSTEFRQDLYERKVAGRRQTFQNMFKEQGLK